MPSSPPPDADAPAAPHARRRFGVLALASAIALVALGAIVVVVTRDSPRSDPRVTQVSTAGVAQPGEPAPGFVMPSLDRKGDVQFAPRGKPTVLTFWASWCTPCRTEFPLLIAAQQDDPNLQVFGVVYKDIPADARGFVKETGAPWPNAIDDAGAVSSAYGVRAIPQLFFINADGVIVSRVFGISSRQDLDKQLAKLR